MHVHNLWLNNTTTGGNTHNNNSVYTIVVDRPEDKALIQLDIIKLGRTGKNLLYQNTARQAEKNAVHYKSNCNVW